MSDSTPSPGDIGFFGILRPPAIEDRFRQAFLPDDSRRVQACCAVAAIAASLIATSDYRLFGATLPFVMLVLVRTAFVLISVMVIVRLRRQLTPVALDRATMVWLLALSAAIIYVDTTRPAGYSGGASLSMLVVLLVYCAAPLPLVLQLIPALVISGALLVRCALVIAPVDATAASAVAISVVVGNLLGVLTSRQLHRSKRHQFLAMLCETELRAELERALGEVKTLRGLLSICAHCKKIRGEDGRWESVDSYVQARTDVEFSHGVCPDCLAKHYGEYLSRGE